MNNTLFQKLLDADCHFGHLKRKWNPKMASYIFMERKGIHIIDLYKTAEHLEEAAAAIKQIAKSGRKILFVATKKQAKSIVEEKVKKAGMPYVVERWLGGMLTNFPTIRSSIRKMSTIDRMKTDGTLQNLSKRERLQISRQREKLDKYFGSIADMNRLPAALFIVDVNKENIAVKEAAKLNIPVFAIVDTNSDPENIKFVIPANDDSSTSINLIIDRITDAVKEGLDERKADKLKMEKEKIKTAQKKQETTETKKEDKDTTTKETEMKKEQKKPTNKTKPKEQKISKSIVKEKKD